ncbi:DUF5671 domain-containing protein [Amaricoccus solimangrovi]|uniref:DUF5671 domain-containing protein n=1 Tax=Amaricoccus solimangrovi TaxID=2589815 RepID=A0A501WQ70_9RHOB|nr:DUF5671 domain-containing protein [Amaricoccus solimangrovi]TPE49387.1 hypothetical protein FJM51_14775 [Amaricoccus solimangrovi]
MRASDALTAYAREALARGGTRPAIARALAEAGWSAGEIEAALSAWIDVPGLPPVPRPRAVVSARDAFRHGLMFFALGMLAVNLNLLVFALIDTWLPDPLEPGLADGAALRWAIAGLVIAYPVWALTSLGLARDAERDPGQRRGAVGRWLTWGALFLAATTLLGNGVAVIAGFLGGDLTPRFLLKAATVAVIAGAIFAYYGAGRREDEE